MSSQQDNHGTKHVVHHYPKSGSIAALLELGGGFFFQVFGVGHIYAGIVATGLLIMFSYLVRPTYQRSVDVRLHRLHHDPADLAVGDGHLANLGVEIVRRRELISGAEYRKSPPRRRWL